MSPGAQPVSISRNYKTKKRSPFFCLGIAVIALFVGVLICVSGLIAIGFYQINRSAVIVDPVPETDIQSEKVTLSASQIDYISRYGKPHSFALLFYTVDDDSGQVITVRDESWTFYDQGKTIHFINGEPAGESTLPENTPSAYPISYSPEQFYGGMPLQEIIANAGLQKYLEIPLEEELVPGSRLYYADRLTFAMKDGELRYIETLTLEGSR